MPFLDHRGWSERTTRMNFAGANSNSILCFAGELFREPFNELLATGDAPRYATGDAVSLSTSSLTPTAACSALAPERLRPPLVGHDALCFCWRWCLSDYPNLLAHLVSINTIIG
eukprot:6401564-Pyramimonas_sp.AAC.1